MHAFPSLASMVLRSQYMAVMDRLEIAMCEDEAAKGSRQTRKKTNLTTAVERIVRVRTHDAISAVTADSTAVGSSMHMKSLTASKCHDAGMNVSAKRIGFYIPATTGHVWFMVIIHNSKVSTEPGWVFTIWGCDSVAMIGQTIDCRNSRPGEALGILRNILSTIKRQQWTCAAVNQNGRELKLNIGNNDLPSDSTQKNIESPKSVTDVITIDGFDNRVNPLNTEIKFTVKNRNTQKYFDSTLSSEVYCSAITSNRQYVSCSQNM